MSRETRCRICGRRLTAPLSVKRMIGPTCWARHQKRNRLENYKEFE